MARPLSHCGECQDAFPDDALGEDGVCGDCAEPVWKPIATAPRDGTVVLVWGNDSGPRCAYFHDWDDGKWIDPHALSYELNPTHWYEIPAFDGETA